ncbi:MAG TPA: RpiB/LacA/LacB family sugar-phosphate isomerase, partial [Clostridiales bacterium]|nr:RpiB/LacA/LacB family sugar-phosphate isomerase [Clostridiales bacterium]
MIAIGCDHGGFALKQDLLAHLKEKGIAVKDYGTDTPDSIDYPVIAEAVCNGITSGECELGILVCGTGIGMSMAANKIKGIRAAAVSETFSA